MMGTGHLCFPAHPSQQPWVTIWGHPPAPATHGAWRWEWATSQGGDNVTAQRNEGLFPPLLRMKSVIKRPRHFSWGMSRALYLVVDFHSFFYMAH